MPAVIDLETSKRYLAGHIPGAAWAAADLGADEQGPRATEFLALADGTEAWERSGLPLESGQGELLSPAVDVYRWPYEGTDVDPAVMRAYLEWEYGLVAQLERDGTHGFRVLVP